MVSTSNILKTDVQKVNEITIDMLSIGADLTDKHKNALLALVNEYRDCFALSIDELGKTSICEMHIKLLDN